MTITSIGYAGQIGAAEWAELQPRTGVFNSVDDYTSFRVSSAVGVRKVAIAPGGATSVGVRVLSSAVEEATLTSVPSGTRWDLVALRRHWASKVSSIVVIAGGSAPSIPTRSVAPGTQYDQPLALVRVIAGSDSIQEIIDLRCIAQNGGLIAFHDLARSYLNQIATTVRIGDQEWTLSVTSAGAPVWKMTDRTDTGWVAVSRGVKWLAVTGYPLEARRVGALIEVRGAVKHDTGALLTSLAVLTSAFIPKGNVPLGAAQTDSTYIGELFVNSSGVISFSSLYQSGSFAAKSVVMIHGVFMKG